MEEGTTSPLRPTCQSIPVPSARSSWQSNALTDSLVQWHFGLMSEFHDNSKALRCFLNQHRGRCVGMRLARTSVRWMLF
jgi:hypothetical protein